MSEPPYSKREDDEFRAYVRAELKEIKEEVKKTNGKVRKIIIAIAVGFGLILGLGSEHSLLLLKLFL